MASRSRRGGGVPRIASRIGAHRGVAAIITTDHDEAGACVVIDHDGTGTLTLSGDNDGFGLLIVGQGTIQLGSDTALRSGTSVSVSAGATLERAQRRSEPHSIPAFDGLHRRPPRVRRRDRASTLEFLGLA